MYDKYPDKVLKIRTLFEKYDFYYGKDEMYSPSNVCIIDTCSVSWKYSDNSCKLSDIEYRFIEEKYFDGSSSENIDITLKDRIGADIVIKKPGHYVVEAMAKSTGETREVHIMYFPQPDYYLPVPLGYQGYVVPAKEPISKLGTPTESSLKWDKVVFGIDVPVSHRTVAFVRTNFLQHTTGNQHRRVDVRYVYADSEPLIIQPGSNIEFPLESIPVYVYEEQVYDPVGRIYDSEIYPEIIVFTTKSYGYYTIEYPESGCKWVY